ncbi:class I SAM-dependent methyltransferase [Mycolicibacterium thermoresistibile]
MVHMPAPNADIDRMPRGGPDASWLDRLLQTDRLEYLDRTDVDASVKRSVVDTLQRVGDFFGQHRQFAQRVLDELAEVPDPRILELGAGHGGLSRHLLEQHPTAQVTITDVDPGSVAATAASDLGSHPRAVVRPLDATAIDADDGQFDLAVFALSFHHLPPAAAAAALAEGTRVADALLVIDLPRPPAPLHLVRLATMVPLAPFVPFVHDGLISSLRTYSRSAFRALAAHADPPVRVSFSGGLLGPQLVLARRVGSAAG